MKIFVLLLLVAAIVAKTKCGQHTVNLDLSLRNSDLHFCDKSKDLTFDYRIALYDFAAKLFKKLGERSQFHFVYSPFSIWRILAAIGEGAESDAQQRLFKYLNVPIDPCTRQRFYDVTNKRIASGEDATITSTRTLIVDESVNLNQDWLSFVLKNSMLDVVSSPIKIHPLVAGYHLQQVSYPLRELNLDGNSIILDSMEYNGWWSTSFADAVIQRAPFHDQSGNKVGAVDLMTVKRHVRMGYVPSVNAKMMELPVGINGRYRMIFSMVLDGKEIAPIVNTVTAELLYEALESVQESRIPLEVAIPRFTMSSNIDVRSILEDIGFPNLWTDPAATEFISAPSAMPTSFVQQATLTMENYGLNPTPLVPEQPNNASTGLHPILGRDFVANRPFLYALLDSETYTFIMSASFSQPTYAL